MIKPPNFDLEIVNHVSNFLLASWSCMVCRCLQRISEWVTENTLSFWVLKCLLKTPKRNWLSSLSNSLTSKESSLSFCLICFLLIIMICQTKGQWRDSILHPWKTNERRGEIKEKKWKKTTTNGNQKCKIHNTEEYHILWWRFKSNQKNM